MPDQSGDFRAPDDPPELEFYRVRPFYLHGRLMAHALLYAPSPSEATPRTPMHPQIHNPFQHHTAFNPYCTPMHTLIPPYIRTLVYQAPLPFADRDVARVWAAAVVVLVQELPLAVIGEGC